MNSWGNLKNLILYLIEAYKENDKLRKENDKLRMYKRSKQASYETMQKMWNDTIWKNRDLEAQLDKKNKIIQEIREVLVNYPEIPDSSKIKGD